MSNMAADIRQHRFQSTDRLLPDANFWIHAYVPREPMNPHARAYTRALSDILNARCRPYIDPLILAEVANRSAHFKYQLLLKTKRTSAVDFRSFCRTPDFADVAEAVSYEIRAVVVNSQPVDVPFTQFDTASVIRDYAEGTCDFNDLLIAELCRRSGLTLVTDDHGFRDSGIPILTANGRLLS
jgi:predicted nucleic acid-binding protein